MSKKAKTHPVDKPTTGINTSGTESTAPATGTESTAPATAPLSDQPGLSVGDLKKIVQIIQICSQRGAFKAEEMKTVGETYTNLVNFLVATGAIPKGDEPAQTSDEAPAVDPAPAPTGDTSTEDSKS
jgi:hypothetical protein